MKRKEIVQSWPFLNRLLNKNILFALFFCIVSVATAVLLHGYKVDTLVGKHILYTYILYENNTEGRTAIKQYCCNCMVGRRTVGCCAHIMTIIWFLSWARYQKIINPPAEFLDLILITYESD
uniref:SFRICE_028392 n=1 Tax=Spodoptera frugiperda TaxID=7108 RepID=A0A2H1VBB2_SPOFR